MAKRTLPVTRSLTKLRLKGYRCFNEEQVAVLRPLTLLVGENSTGKTSFAAMIRLLDNAFMKSAIMDFKESPYDLGSFDEIAHKRVARGSQVGEFSAGFDACVMYKPQDSKSYSFDVSFLKRDTTPVPKLKIYSHGEASIEEHFKEGDISKVIVRTQRGTWEKKADNQRRIRNNISFAHMDIRFPTLISHSISSEELSDFIPLGPDGNDITQADMDAINDVISVALFTPDKQPHATAPVRSKPKRTYNTSIYKTDPEGDYIPMLLANMASSSDLKGWQNFKDYLESFGKEAGLFDEIRINQLGRNPSEPFQVQMRKYDRGYKGSYHNLIDVGYGVSQILPVITELRNQGTGIFLLQQPEVHLHPKAQAALGSLFCDLVKDNYQVVVETHSDYLIDRIRMEVRDKTLAPQDVSLIFFERVGLDVKINSLGFDQEGNVVGLDQDGNITEVPTNYRQFFMEEMKRSLGMN